MKCPICGTGVLVAESRDLIYEYKGRSATIHEHGEFCTHCTEGIFNSEEGQRISLLLQYSVLR